ncbi:DUF1127 domain-containing protein [Methyloversatilis sp.]|uniref:DUF1127 domain-containing protein n=1 Tax=Methyloversatilis sp. TaxID=2569862 RepID=UPI00273321FD|nr:DUF1127 domain-containing protein [Methyloversatilis sp.]MDP2869458.1 DUF1127 domain-containing protein [Methyloversatilis sp.]MDP3288175.1 DUF1127 domain-containing protein [Methyloversatilis sp.]MDP3455268.1 DUF1127 domain-containing protein [Methyloversatilis sp.]MDP3578462.1 DUF1127 domain-containing protein [Methyloversatilis sp.]
MSAPGWIRNWVRQLGEAGRRRRARAELRAMNDLELRDIGLGRSDIPSVLSGQFGRVDGPGAQAGR